MQTEFRCKKCNRLLFIRKWATGVPLIRKTIYSVVQLCQPAIEVKCPKCKNINQFKSKVDTQVQITREGDTICISGGTEKYPADISAYNVMHEVELKIKGNAVIGENTN